MCLGIGFERLVTLDIMIYGLSLILEFLALIFLRIREPGLARPFRVPGGVPGAVLLGVCPLLLLILSVVRGEQETIFGMNGLLFGALLIAAGFLAYLPTLLAAQPTRKESDANQG